MRRRLVLATALAAALLIAALNQPSPPPLTTPVDLQTLIQIIKSNPALLQEALKFLNETRLNITLPTPPKAQPTQITITTNATEAPAGGAVKVSGQLTARGKPLPREHIAIYLQGRPVALATTDEDGKYAATISVSVYAPAANITALYMPPPGSPYAPSNATAQIRVIYNQTTITIAAPKEVKWGDPIPVEIRQAVPLTRKVVVTITNGTAAVTYETVITDAAALVIPTTDLTPGNYTITATAQPLGTWAPSTATTRVVIAAEKPKITLQAPPILVAGLPAQIHAAAEPEIPIYIYLGGRPLNGAVPLDASTGPTTLKAATQRQPPYDPAQATTEVFIVNPIQAAAIATALALAIRLRPKTRLQEVKKEVIAAATARRRQLPPETEEALNVLATAFHTLGERAGLHYHRKMTYREYAAKVEPYAHDKNCLWRIVTLAERGVYSPLKPHPVELTEAWTCIEQL